MNEERCRQCNQITGDWSMCRVCDAPVCAVCAVTITRDEGHGVTTLDDLHSKWCHKPDPED